MSTSRGVGGSFHKDRSRPRTLYTVWGQTKGARGWLPLVSGLSQQVAVEELVQRQDRVRRAGYQTRFTISVDGVRPDEQ